MGVRPRREVSGRLYHRFIEEVVHVVELADGEVQVTWADGTTVRMDADELEQRFEPVPEESSP